MGAQLRPLNDPPRRTWRAVGTPRVTDVVVLAWSVLFIGWLLFDWGGRPWAPPLDLILFAGIAVATTVQQMRVARLVGWSRDQLAWGLLAAASVSRLVSGSVWGLFVEFSGSRAEPTWLVVLSLGYLALGIAALLVFPGAPRHATDRVRFRLDTAMVIIGSLLIVWYAAIGPFIRSSGIGQAPLGDVASTIGDSAAIILAAVLNLRADSRATRVASAFLLVAFVLHVIPDLGFWRSGWFETYAAGDGIAGFWYGAWFAKWLAARAAESAVASPPRRPSGVAGSYSSGWVPHAFLVAAVGLMLLKQFTSDQEDRELFAVGSAILAILIVWRQGVELRERDRLQEALKAQEQRFRALLQHAYDAVLLLDDEYRIRYASPPAERLLGAGRLAASPSILSLAIHPADGERLRVALAAADVGPSTMTLRIEGPDGEWRTFEGHLQDLRRDPLIGGFVLHGFDRTREVQLADGLRDTRQLEALGVLASGLAHDLNNILTVIASHVELLREDAAIEGRAREDLDAIHTASGRAQALTRGLLTLSRRKETPWRIVSLGELGRDRMAQRGLRELVAPAGTREPVEVRGDPVALAQVVDAALDELARTGTAAPLVARTSERHLDAGVARRAQLDAGVYAALELGPAFAAATWETEVAVRTSDDGEWDLAPSDLSMLMALATTREAGGTLLRERSNEGVRFTILLPTATQ